jgi:hypothetical protein
VHYGLDTDSKRVGALERIRQGVASGQLIVPVMQANVLEASEAVHRDRARRRRLAEFMLIGLAGNCCIVLREWARSNDANSTFGGMPYRREDAAQLRRQFVDVWSS